MDQIREYAIHRLSIEGVLTAIEKIQLARAYRVANWMEEGVINLINGGHRLTRADLTTLGWETSALILWMKDTMSFLNSSPLRFTPDMIQCGKCSSNLTSVLYSECVSCDEPIDMGELEHTAPVTSLAPGTIDPLVKLECICCTQCEHRFYTKNVRCPSCSSLARDCGIRITLKKRLDEKIDEVFGEEIRDHFQTQLLIFFSIYVSSTVNRDCLCILFKVLPVKGSYFQRFTVLRAVPDVGFIYTEPSTTIIQLQMCRMASGSRISWHDLRSEQPISCQGSRCECQVELEGTVGSHECRFV